VTKLIGALKSVHFVKASNTGYLMLVKVLNSHLLKKNRRKEFSWKFIHYFE